MALPASSASRSPSSFGLLIQIARLQRRILIGRRMLDIAVNADGAAMHHAAHAAVCRDLDNAARRFGIDGAILGRSQPRLPVERGDVVDDLDAAHRRLEAGAVAKVADRQLDARLLQALAALRIAHKRSDGIAASREGPRQMATRESCGAGD